MAGEWCTLSQASDVVSCGADLAESVDLVIVETPIDLNETASTESNISNITLFTEGGIDSFETIWNLNSQIASLIIIIQDVVIDAFETDETRWRIVSAVSSHATSITQLESISTFNTTTTQINLHTFVHLTLTNTIYQVETRITTS